MVKQIVNMIVKFNQAGKVIPMAIIWPDGKQCHIDKVLDVRPAASLKLGGHGIRYRVRVMNKEIDIFNDDGIWFLDAIERN